MLISGEYSGQSYDQQDFNQNPDIQSYGQTQFYQQSEDVHSQQSQNIDYQAKYSTSLIELTFCKLIFFSFKYFKGME